MGAVIKPVLRIIESPALAGITAHEKLLRRMPCVVSGQTPVTLHHCKGGSMRDLLGCAGNPGKGAKVSDWLQIPLHWRYHTGDFGIDSGQGIYKSKEHWELAFGKQVDFLARISQALGYDVFAKAGFRVYHPGLAGLPGHPQLDMLK